MANTNQVPQENLPNRAIIELRGQGTLSFLHNILTCSVESLSQDGLAYGALLSPQGKILHDVFVHNTGETVFLDYDTSAREDLIAKLKLYRLRAKLDINPRDDLTVEVGTKGAADPRHAALGHRRITKNHATPSTHYAQTRFRLGIADSQELGSGKLFPHEANFDLISAVDFKKGCYIGQEVVSRMEHRATARSRILPVSFVEPPAGDEIRMGENLIGELLGQNGNQGLALVRLDRWSEYGAPEGITISKPDWMNP